MLSCSVPTPRKAVSKEKHRICVACENTALKHSNLCDRCTRRLAGDVAADSAEVMKWIREAVTEGVKLPTRRVREETMSIYSVQLLTKSYSSTGYQSPIESDDKELMED